MNKEVLKNRNFVFLILAKCVSLIGTDMQNFALSLYVLKITGSSTIFASALAVSMLPKLILGPFGGVIVDWFYKKKVIIALDAISGFVVIAAAVKYFLTGSFELPYIYTLIICLSLVSVFYDPAIGSIVPTIVEKENLINANSINSMVLSLCQIIAPIVAGMVYGLFGIFLVFIVNGVSFLMAALIERVINIPKVSKANQEHSLKAFKIDFLEGLSFIKNNKLVFKLVLCAVIVNFAFNPIFSIGLVFISKTIIKVSDFQYGLIQSFIVVGMLIGPLFAGYAAKKIKLEKMFYMAIYLFSLLILAYSAITFASLKGLFQAIITPMILIIIVSLAICFISTILNISLNTMFQRTIPLSLLGRVGAVMSTLCMAAIPAGQILYGKMFSSLSAYIPMIVTAAIMSATATYYMMTIGKSTKDIDQSKVEYEESISI